MFLLLLHFGSLKCWCVDGLLQYYTLWLGLKSVVSFLSQYIINGPLRSDICLCFMYHNLEPSVIMFSSELKDLTKLWIQFRACYGIQLLLLI